MGLRVLFEAALKEVERRVITAIQNILHILLQGHFQLPARVTLPNLKLAVPEPLEQPLHLPLVQPRPLVRHPSDYHRPRLVLEHVHELLRTDLVVMYPLNIISDCAAHVQWSALLSRLYGPLEDWVDYLSLAEIVVVSLPVV